MPRKPSRPKTEIKTKTLKEELLSFRITGRVFPVDGLAGEFELMRTTYGKPVGPEEVARIAAGSGTHLLKLIVPTAEKSQAVLRAKPTSGDAREVFLPSVNAPDIPIAKIVYRPLEIEGHEARSLAEHILNPDDISEEVYRAFARVFGQDTFDTLLEGLRSPLEPITTLPAVDFPIIFVPRPGGGDLQLTPLSPASSYMGFKNEVRTLTRENRNKQVVRRGWWARQSISAKPQNISGAIGGPRERFLVSAPPQLSRRQAEIYRYARGGRFPKFDDSGVVEALLSYMQNVEKGVYALRMTIDRQADGIIEAALDFIDETMAAARDVATGFGVTTLPDPPTPQDLIFRMTYWGDRQAAVRQALTGRHFMNRASQILARRS